MTDLLRLAFAWAGRLPEAEQDDVARLLLLELSDREQPAHPTRRVAPERNGVIPFRQTA